MIKHLVEKTIPGLHDFLIIHLPPLNKDIPVLDIGCGSGAWLNRLYQMGFRNLYGIDKDNCFIFNNANFRQVDIDKEEVEFKNIKFGLITAIEVIEHLENIGHLIYLVSTHLDDNGYFLLTTPNIHSIESRLRFFITGNIYHFSPPSDPTHIFPIYLAGFERLIARYNLKICEKWGYPPKGYINKISTLVKIFSNLLRGFLIEPISGEVMCVLIKKTFK